jgi:hypothetical protein
MMHLLVDVVHSYYWYIFILFLLENYNYLFYQPIFLY